MACDQIDALCVQCSFASTAALIIQIKKLFLSVIFWIPD